MAGVTRRLLVAKHPWAARSLLPPDGEHRLVTENGRRGTWRARRNLLGGQGLFLGLPPVPALRDGLGRLNALGRVELGCVESVERTSNARSSQTQDVRVDHRRLDVGVTHQLLDRADVVTGGEQVSGEGVPQRAVSRPW